MIGDGRLKAYSQVEFLIKALYVIFVHGHFREQKFIKRNFLITPTWLSLTEGYNEKREIYGTFRRGQLAPAGAIQINFLFLHPAPMLFGAG